MVVLAGSKALKLFTLLQGKTGQQYLHYKLIATAFTIGMLSSVFAN